MDDDDNDDALFVAPADTCLSVSADTDPFFVSSTTNVIYIAATQRVIEIQGE